MPDDAPAARDRTPQQPTAATVYIASKTKHAPKWRELRDAGYRIIATWINEAGPADLGDLAERCIREAKDADAFIIYCEAGDVLKGAWVEAGARLAAGKVVLAVGPFDRSAFTHHVNWRRRETMDDALALIAACRAAGAATPPADAPDYCRERDAAYERYMGKRPRDPDGRDEDVWVTSRNAFRAGWDARGALAAGAGAATLALTAIEVEALDLAVQWLPKLPNAVWVSSGVSAAHVVRGLRDRLTAATAGGVAAAPSPAATTPRQRKCETWAEAREAIRAAGGDAWDKIEDPDHFIRWMRGYEDAPQPPGAPVPDWAAADAHGPQREEPTPL